MPTSSGPRLCSSIAELRAVAQPPEHSPAITDAVYRAGSIYLSIPLARLGVSPNAVTVGWILLGLAGIAFIAAGPVPARVTGALVLQLSYLLDYVDGEVARLTARRSRAGQLLDLLGHGVHKATLPLAAAWAASTDDGAPLLLLAGAVGAAALTVGDALRFYAASIAGDLRSGDLGHVVRPHADWTRVTPVRLLRALFLMSFESPGLYALTVAAAILDHWAPLVVYWAVGGAVWLVHRAVLYADRLETRGRPPTAAE